ncbi:MAG TPA: acyl-CoA dehydrogenase [Mycobacterium sp.]|nr:acyl-CoA dehydrogenase [Mycobacterium sp.]
MTIDTMYESAPGAQERAALRESARSLLRREWSGRGSATAVPAGPEAVPAIYRTLAEHGFTEFGGPASGTTEEGSGVQEICVLMEELGRASCPAPILPISLLNRVAFSGVDGSPEVRRLTAAIQRGEQTLAWSFGAHDDSVSRRLELAEGKLSGSVDHVECGAEATWTAVVLDDRIALVATAGPAVVVEATRLFDRPGSARMCFDGAAALTLPLHDGGVGDLLLLAQLAMAARALGAADRAVDLAVEYATVRKQFDQPIGRFQAIQHKLANCWIVLQATRLGIRNAARQCDAGSRACHVLTAAAVVHAGLALRRVSLETHHTFGAIGYSEEHEAPRHFRQIHLDVLRFGGSTYAREVLAQHFLGTDPRGFPEYELSPDAEAFRVEVRAWLAEHWSGERKAAHDRRPFHEQKFDAEFALEVGRTGWNGLTWPKQFGGMARGIHEQLILLEEFARVDAPRVGAAMHAIVLQLHGTPAQQERYLPEILAGRAIWGIGYSEPDSGSDLASIRTTAVRDGDYWVLNGEKVWTTTYWGQYMFVAARTDPSARSKRRGISIFIVPTDNPGLTFRPTETLYSGTFANVIYDNVRLPADALLGEENDGWAVMGSALATERGVVGAGIVIPIVRAFEQLCEHLCTATRAGRPMCKDPLVRARIAELASEVEAARQMMLHCAELGAARGGETPAGDASASKVFAGELMERLTEAAVEMLGTAGTVTLDSPGAVLGGRFEQLLRHSLMWVISLGTNEIQRNIIAQQALGLPR